MANQVNIDVSQLASVVHSMVQYNIDENIEKLRENVSAAADHAVAELKVTSATKDAWRGTSSISEEIGAYREGWRAYNYTSRKDSVLSVVAQAHFPSLTHLLEDGHEYWYYGVHVGGRVPGNKAIATAYENAAPIAVGGS